MYTSHIITGVRAAVLAVLMLFAAEPLQAADRHTMRRLTCTPGITQENTRAGGTRRLSTINVKWQADAEYHVPVILISFPDRQFTIENPQDYYDRLFNEPGYNLGKGPGCVADYFIHQSDGLCHFVFDIVGPIEVETGYKKSGEYGANAFKYAAIKADSLLNYSKYDWNGDGSVEAVVYVYAGYGGNESSSKAYNCIWPNTALFSEETLDGVKVGSYTASAELWSNNKSCGIGTICHEFSHVLGLPDFYPTSKSDEYSVLDEWDLMDGGNYTNLGWCPPNYSAHEREYVGWQKAEELDADIDIKDMPSFNSSGRAYKVTNDYYPAEYYLIENRQREGWDMMLPGHGLLITHVDFRKSLWEANQVNVDQQHHRLEYFHADGHDYNYFDELYPDSPPLVNGYCVALQNTAYPYVDSLGVNHCALSDFSDPPAMLFHENAAGTLLMGKPLNYITESEGLVSFKFSTSNTGIIASAEEEATPVAWYDLQGRRVAAPASGLYIVRYSNGHVKKVLR